MAFRLSVPNVDTRTFYSYWYGIGELIEVSEGSVPGTFSFVVDYGDDDYRAQYQADRFASGLYFAKVEEYHGR